jgi:drug/metabolite transporter (DMT)-like permease
MFWIIPALFSAFADANKDYVSKRAMQTVNHYVAAWALMTLILPFLSIALLFIGIPMIGPLFLEALIVNSMVYVISVVLYMKAISISPLSLTLPMIAFTPAFMLITGPLILNEFPKPMGILGITGVVIGVYILKVKDVKKGLLHPFISLFKEKGPLLMFIVAVMWSFTGTTTKFLVTQSNTVFALFSLYVLSASVFTVFIFATKKVKIKDISGNLKNISGIGFFMSLSEIGLVYSYTMTLAVYAIAVKRLSILIGSFYGFKFFKEGDVIQRASGSILMFLGVILMAL